MSDGNRRPDLSDLNVPYEAMRAKVWNDPDKALVNYYAMNFWVGLALLVVGGIITLIVDGLGIKW